MTLQKYFLFASLPVAGSAFSYLWSQKIYALFSSLRHDCEFQEISFFTADTNFSPPIHVLWSRRLAKKARVTKKEFNIGY